MASEAGGYDQDLEDRIVKIIGKIREKRCRPCFQNIYTKLIQGGKEINMDDLKVFIGNMIQSGLLIDKGGTDKESFYLNNGESDIDQVEFEDSELQNNFNISSSEGFFNEQLYQSLLIRINTEVKTAVKLEMSNLINDDKHKHFNNKIQLANDQTDNKSLKDEIKSLRINLKHKDELIKKLTSDLMESKKQLLNNKLLKKNVSKINSTDKNNITVRSNDGNQSTNFNDTEFNNNKRSITVLGDSIVKDVKPFKMKRMLDKNDRLYVKCFPGANVTDMIDYSKPSLRRKPNVIIYHAGTNSLNTEEQPNKIAKDIIKQAIDMKTDHNKIFISSILFRNDKLNEKGMIVNDFLKIKCSDLDLCYIDNSNITNAHLNKSGIHLNMTGTITLAKNFMEAIKN